MTRSITAAGTVAAMNVTGGQHLLAVAHRAGNNLTRLRAALDAGVDLIEADVHHYRGALEVRHGKALGRHVLWDEGELTWRRDQILPNLKEVLAELNGDPRVMLDLKGPSLAVAGQVAALLRDVAPGVPVTVCTRQWRMFDAFADDPHVRQVLSAANHLGLARLRARLRRRPAFGVSIHRRLLTPAIVAELRRAVQLVLVWPVDTPAALEHARRLGVSGVISKSLPMLGTLLAARQAGQVV